MGNVLIFFFIFFSVFNFIVYLKKVGKKKLGKLRGIHIVPNTCRQSSFRVEKQPLLWDQKKGKWKREKERKIFFEFILYTLLVLKVVRSLFDHTRNI